jgi:hypothetical protein
MQKLNRLKIRHPALIRTAATSSTVSNSPCKHFRREGCRSESGLQTNVGKNIRKMFEKYEKINKQNMKKICIKYAKNEQKIFSAGIRGQFLKTLS